MINLYINTRKISASNLDTLAVGNVNSISVRLTFSPEWDGLARTAVFSNGEARKSVGISSDTCLVPWELLAQPGEMYVSVRGTGDGGELVICTENAFLGRVVPSNASVPASEAAEVTPDVLDSLLADVAQLKQGGGVAGADGKSAYELAVEHGFEGSEDEWLASLKGSDGNNGTDGLNGADGADGHTPVKGIDYFTDADISVIVDSVLGALPHWEGGSY